MEVSKENKIREDETNNIDELLQYKRLNIKFGGRGGQGIMLMAYLMGKAAIFQGLNALQTQKYGPENRGALVESNLVISNDEIKFPLFEDIHILISMTPQYFERYRYNIVNHGLIFVDSTFIKEIGGDPNTFGIPATQLAEKNFGSPIYANLIMLGAILKILSRLIEKKHFIEAIKESVPESFVEADLKAFSIGYELDLKGRE